MEESDFIITDVLPLRKHPSLVEEIPGDGSGTPDSVREEFGEAPIQNTGSHPPVLEEIMHIVGMYPEI